jgi:putative acetyltransferase
MKIKIRQEKPTDQLEVFEINRLAFGQDNEATLVDALRENRNDFLPELSFVATMEDKTVGYILFTKIDNSGNINQSLALAPVAVIPEYQKKGIGKALIEVGLQKAKELNFKSVIVLGHKDYYPKFGFLPAKKWNIYAPFSVNMGSFMAIELVPEGLKNVSGIVKYPKEFDDV